MTEVEQVGTDVAIADVLPRGIVGAFNPTLPQLALLKRTVAAGTTNDQFELFLMQCRRTGLDPFARQIYCVLRRDGDSPEKKMSIQTSIDGHRLIAERTGHYAGQLGPEWCGEDGQWKDVWLEQKAPTAARVFVMRDDFKEPLKGVALWKAYAVKLPNGSLNNFWSKMPEHMLAKVAEALALRRAFPQELSGLYTDDEMDGMDFVPTPKPIDLPIEERRENMLKRAANDFGYQDAGGNPDVEAARNAITVEALEQISDTAGLQRAYRQLGEMANAG